MIEKKQKLKPMKTVLAISLSMIIAYFITESIELIYAALCIGFLGLCSSYLAKKIDFLWMKLTGLLSKIISNILLSITFYFLLTPLAVLSRIFGKKNQLTLKNSEKTLFKNCDKEYKKISFENPW